MKKYFTALLLIIIARTDICVCFQFLRLKSSFGYSFPSRFGLDRARKMAESEFVNMTEKGEIPTFEGSDKAKATDFANYFCSYAQLYHQKQMLADHNRMAAYHAAIIGNADVFKDKVVMDVGTGSGILAAWAAHAGAKRVYASEFLIRCHLSILSKFNFSLVSGSS